MTSIHSKQKKPVSPALKAKLRRYAALEIGYLVQQGYFQLIEVPEDQRLPLPVTDDANADAIVAAATAIAERRASRLLELRTALQSGERELALTLAATLCGLREVEDEASHSASTRLN